MIWMKHKHQKCALNAVNAEMHSSMNSYLWYKSMFKESASGCEKWSRNKVFAGLLYKEKSGHWEVHVKSELQKTVYTQVFGWR